MIEKQMTAAVPGRILVADDEETFRETTIALLRRDGYDAVGAANTQQAMAQIAQSDFDLLLCDISIPNNGELEFVRDLQKTAPQLPVILITGYPSVETAVPAVQLAVVSYLIKPVQPADLLKLVRQTFEQRRACRNVQESVLRVEQWHRDLQAVSASLRPKSPDAFNQTVGTFLTLTIRNIIDALTDIRNTIQTVVSAQPSPEVIRAMESSKPVMLVGALQDTIRVLEHTKVNFKSKELGELRERLEGLLRETVATGHT